MHRLVPKLAEIVANPAMTLFRIGLVRTPAKPTALHTIRRHQSPPKQWGRRVNLGSNRASPTTEAPNLEKRRSHT